MGKVLTGALLGALTIKFLPSADDLLDKVFNWIDDALDPSPYSR